MKDYLLFSQNPDVTDEDIGSSVEMTELDLEKLSKMYRCEISRKLSDLTNITYVPNNQINFCATHFSLQML